MVWRPYLISDLWNNASYIYKWAPQSLITNISSCITGLGYPTPVLNKFLNAPVYNSKAEVEAAFAAIAAWSTTITGRANLLAQVGALLTCNGGYTGANRADIDSFFQFAPDRSLTISYAQIPVQMRVKQSYKYEKRETRHELCAYPQTGYTKITGFRRWDPNANTTPALPVRINYAAAISGSIYTSYAAIPNGASWPVIDETYMIAHGTYQFNASPWSAIYASALAAAQALYPSAILDGNPAVDVAIRETHLTRGEIIRFAFFSSDIGDFDVEAIYEVVI